MTPALKEKLKTLPAAPGVYFHKDKTGKIIYVGKAAVLKNRVRQYFQNTEKDPKTAALVAEIADTDWVVVDTEMDALFLESEMIKRYMPKWNILLRDDKNVSYVRINIKAEVPDVSITRNPLDDKATYIGPFYAKNTITTALRILRRVFPYYDKPYTGKKTLDTDLGLTPGIEVGRSTPAEYKKSLRNLIRYLNGDRQTLLKDLEKQMKEASRAQKYEEAAALRNQLYGLKGLRRKIVFSDKEFLDISNDKALAELQTLLNLDKPCRRIEGYDISHQSGLDTVASMVVFINGASDRTEYRKFKIRQDKNDDFSSLREVMERRLKHKEWDFPDVILVDGGRPQLEALKEVLDPTGIPYIGRDKSGDHSHNAPVALIIPARFLNQPSDQPTDQLSNPTNQPYISHVLRSDSHLAKLIARIDEESHRFAITYHRLLKQKRLFK